MALRGCPAAPSNAARSEFGLTAVGWRRHRSVRETGTYLCGGGVTGSMSKSRSLRATRGWAFIARSSCVPVAFVRVCGESNPCGHRPERPVPPVLGLDPSRKPRPLKRVAPGAALGAVLTRLAPPHLVNPRHTHAGVRSVFVFVVATAVVGGSTIAQEARPIALRAPDVVSAVAFSRVTSVRELRDGSLLVADQPEGRLVLLPWASAEATVIGRPGNGPGEYRGAGWLYALPGDSTLFTDAFLGRWLLLDGSRIGATVVEQSLVNRLLPAQLAGADGLGHVLGVRASLFTGRVPQLLATADSLVLLLADRATQHVDTIARLKGRGSGGFHIGRREGGRPPSIVVANPLASEEQALLFGDGWIAVARSEPYRVDWRAPDGRWVRGAPLPFAAVRVNDRERCAAMERVLGSAGGCDPSSVPGWPETVPPFLPPLQQRLSPTLLAAPDGRLVIARTPSATSQERHHDVVDRTGRLAGVISVGASEALIGFGARSVYTLATDDEGVQTVRRRPWP